MPKIIPLQNLEDNRNKVTIIDETANDEQYPSSKAVYKELSVLHNMFVTNNGTNMLNPKYIQRSLPKPDIPNEGELDWGDDTGTNCWASSGKMEVSGYTTLSCQRKSPTSGNRELLPVHWVEWSLDEDTGNLVDTISVTKKGNHRTSPEVLYVSVYFDDNALSEELAIVVGTALVPYEPYTEDAHKKVLSTNFLPEDDGYIVNRVSKDDLINHRLNVNHNNVYCVSGEDVIIDTITSELNDVWKAQEVTIVADGRVTMKYGNGILLNGRTDFSMKTGDTLTLLNVWAGNRSRWVEKCRSINNNE